MRSIDRLTPPPPIRSGLTPPPPKRGNLAPNIALNIAWLRRRVPNIALNIALL